MRRNLLFIGAFALLCIVGTEAKKGQSKNHRKFWDIWSSDPEPATGATDDLFLENEGSGKEEVGTHTDDEDFDVSSGDGDATTEKTRTHDPDDYDDYSDHNDWLTTEKPKTNKPTDDEDLYEGSGEEGSGEKTIEEPIVPVKTIPLGTDSSDKPKQQLTPCQQLRATALDVAEFVPRCTDTGAFEKQQCLGLYCWCVDPTGVEIRGTKLEYPTTPDCDFGTNLTTCVFQLVQHSQGLLGQYKPRCDKEGQYERIQCQENECWCVDAMGNEILGTFVQSPKMPVCGDKKEATMKPSTTEKPRNNKPYEPKNDNTGYDVIPGEDDKNVIVQMGPDKINKDSGEREEEKTHTVGDNDTVYADQVQQSPLMAKPGLLAAIIAGAVVGLLLMVLLVMFIVYRMRKKDEGSYPLDEQKYQNYPYAKAPTKEFYA